jgi:hypothetical protein
LSGASLGTVFSAGLSVLGGGTVFGGLSASMFLPTTAGFVGAAAVGGAVGSIAGQAVGIATGVQDEFSWKSVGLAALGAAVTSGIGALSGGAAAGNNASFLGISQAKDPLLFAAARGVTNSLVTQGLGSALGLQSFSWKAIAVSAITAPLNAAINKYGLNEMLKDTDAFVRDSVTGIVNGTLAQSVRMQVYSDGKVDWASIAADAFGNAIGNSVVSSMQGGSTTASATQQRVDNDENYRLPGSYVTSDGSAENRNPVPVVEFDPQERAWRQANDRMYDELGLVPGGGTIDDEIPGQNRGFSRGAGRDRLVIGGEYGESAEALERRNALAQLKAKAQAYNAAVVSAEAAAGGDLSPTVANAARLQLFDVSGELPQMTVAPNSAAGAISAARLSGWGRAGAHTMGAYDAGAGAVESAGYSLGIVGTPESRAAWAVETSRAAVDGLFAFTRDPGGSISNWWNNLTGDDPAAIRQATAQGVGIAGSLLASRYVGRLAGDRVPATALDGVGDVANTESAAARFAKRPTFFNREVEWTAPSERGTGQTYKVFQREIDWDFTHKGQTNLDRALNGGSPFIEIDGKPVQLHLHHSRQNAQGPLFELNAVTHMTLDIESGFKALHPFSPRPHPDFPVNRPLFDTVDRPAYWTWRAQQEIAARKVLGR